MKNPSLNPTEKFHIFMEQLEASKYHLIIYVGSKQYKFHEETFASRKEMYQKYEELMEKCQSCKRLKCLMCKSCKLWDWENPFPDLTECLDLWTKTHSKKETDGSP